MGKAVCVQPAGRADKARVKTDSPITEERERERQRERQRERKTERKTEREKDRER